MIKLLLLAAVIWFIVPLSFAQTVKKTFITPVNDYPGQDRIKKEKGSFVPTEMRAVSIARISVEGKNIAVGEPFGASKDWLKSLAVELKNISGLPIKAIRLSLILPETKINEVTSSISLEYGKDLSYGMTKDEMPLIFPGQKIQLSRGDLPHQRDIQQIEKRTGLSDFSEIVLASVTVKFDNGIIWSSQRLPFEDGKERHEDVLAASTNLIGTSDSSTGSWKMTGEASVEKTSDPQIFTIRNGASFSRTIAIPKNSDAKFMLLISRCSSERLEVGTITGLPYLYGRWMSGATMLDQPLQGNRTLCELGEPNSWATSWGIFKIPTAATSVNLNLNQAEGKGFPQNGSSARFSSVGLYVFNTEADARKFVNVFNDRHRNSERSN